MKHDKLLLRVRAKVERGERLTAEEAEQLLHVTDLNALSRIARIARERRFGKDALYLVAYTAGYTGEDPGLFVSELETLAHPDDPELAVHMHHWSRRALGEWEDILETFGESRRPITCLVNAETVSDLADESGVGPAEVYATLSRKTPLRVVPTDGRRVDLSDLESARASTTLFDTHQSLHAAGIRTDSGVAFHADDGARLLRGLIKTRDLQDATGGFARFTPIPLSDPNSDASYGQTPSAVQTLRAVAVSRVFLDNIEHISFPIRLVDPELAFVGLTYGVDTIDSTFPRDDGAISQPVGESGDLELNVLDGGGDAESDIEPGWIEDRIVESRFRPVPSLLDGERLKLVS